MCDASEIMLGAYCQDGIGSLRIIGVAGADCEGDPDARVVLTCLKR